MSSIETTIAKIRKKYEQNYGFAILDLDFEETSEAVILKGKVLTENQRDEVAAAVSEACGKKVKNEIKTLSDIRAGEAGWSVVKSRIADMRSRFVPSAAMNEKIRNRVRSTQAKRGEVLRVLLFKDDQMLVQSGDLTLGWINRSEAVLKKISLRKEWHEGVFAQPDKLIAIKGGGEKIIKEAEKFLGVKYVLGAKSDLGIDCSGLTQCAYKNAIGIILPRHSWDQKKMGVPADLDNAEKGDLIFMINKDTGTKHVGIWNECGGKPCIVHASFSQGKVICQASEEVFLDYNLVEVRRIIKK